MTWLFSFSMLNRCCSTWTSPQGLSKLLCWCKADPKLVPSYHVHVLGSNILESSPGGSPSLWKSSPASIFISFRTLSSSAFARAWAWMISSSALSASASRLLHSARSCHRHGWIKRNLSCYRQMFSICLGEVNTDILVKHHHYFTSINWPVKTLSFHSDTEQKTPVAQITQHQPLLSYTDNSYWSDDKIRNLGHWSVGTGKSFQPVQKACKGLLLLLVVPCAWKAN